MPTEARDNIEDHVADGDVDAEPREPKPAANPVQSNPPEPEADATDDPVVALVKPEAPPEPKPEEDDPKITLREAAEMFGMHYQSLVNLRVKHKGTVRALPCKRDPNRPSRPYTARRSAWVEWRSKHSRKHGAPPIPDEEQKTTDDPYLSQKEIAPLIGSSQTGLRNMRGRMEGTERALPGFRDKTRFGAPYVARKSEWMAWAEKHYRTSMAAQRGYGIAKPEPESPAEPEQPPRELQTLADLLSGVEMDEVHRRCAIALSHLWQTGFDGVIKRLLSCPPALLASKVEGIEAGSTFMEISVPPLAQEMLEQRGRFLGKTAGELIEDTLKQSVALGGYWR